MNLKAVKTTKSTPRKDDNFGEIQKPKRKMLIIRHLFNAVYLFLGEGDT